MRMLVINGDFLAQKTFAGVARVATEVLSELDRLFEPDKAIILTPMYAQRHLELKNIKVIKYGSKSLNLWKQIDLVKYVKKNDAVLLDLTQAFPLVDNAVVFIHDCIPELLPQSYESFVKRMIRRPIKLVQRKLAAKKSNIIFTVSEHSQNDISRLMKVNKDKIIVAYNGWQHMIKVNPDYSILEKFPQLSGHDFCFTLGSRVWHKNLTWIINAAKQNPNYYFVISGEDSYFRQIDNAKQSAPMNIIFTGYISDGNMVALMKECKAFVFPSLYEGFGIPPMEALAVGTEIICSNSSCLPEIYGESAHYIDPFDYDHINIDEILQTEVCNASEILEKYSWMKTAKIIFDEVCDVMNRG